MQGRDHYGGGTFTAAGRAIRQVRVMTVSTTLIGCTVIWAGSWLPYIQRPSLTHKKKVESLNHTLDNYYQHPFYNQIVADVSNPVVAVR